VGTEEELVKKIATIGLLSLVLVGCVSSGGPGGPPAASPDDGPGDGVLLTWKWVEGDARRYRVTEESETKVTADVLPAPFAFRMTQTYEMTHEIEHITHDGIARVEVTFGRLDVVLATLDGTREIKWSSDDPAEPLPGMARNLLQGLDVLAGRSVAFWVDDRGEALEVEDLEELVEELAEHWVGERPEDFQDLATLVSEEVLFDLAGLGVLVLPYERVAVGEGWTADLSLPLPLIGGVEHVETVTLESVERQEAVLRREAQVSLGGGNELAEELGIPQEALGEVSVDMETRRGEIDGTLRFDLERGLLVHEVYDMALDLTITMSSADEASGRDPMVLYVDSESRETRELLGE
jgi:hypothetical protein